jgi:trimeric autotransporter adhesin
MNSGRNVFRFLCLLFVVLAVSLAGAGQSKAPTGQAGNGGGGNNAPCPTCVSTTGGTSGKLPVFTGATTVGDSIVSQTSPTAVSVSGSLAVSQGLSAGSAVVNGNLTAVGNITTATGTVSAATVTSTGAVSGANIATTGNVSAGGNISGANISGTGLLAVSGGASIGGNAAVTGDVNAANVVASGTVTGNGVNIPSTSTSSNSPSNVLDMWSHSIDPTTNAATNNHYRWQVAPTDFSTNPSTAPILNLAYDDGVSSAIPVAQFFSNGSLSVVGVGGGLYGEDSATTAGATGVIGLTRSTGGVGVQGVAFNTSGSTGGSAAVLGTSRATSGYSAAIRGEVRGPGAFAGVFDVRSDLTPPGTPLGNILVGRVGPFGGLAPVFRVDSAGKGYFNGGTQTGGADFAESFDVLGVKSDYEPGDVLAIDTTATRRVKLADESYSTLVSGIYSTKPGVLATPHDIESPKVAAEVPMAIVGIVPCKVTAKNGAIRTGDLLVSSDIPGFAMKGTDRSRMLGAVLGKALQPLPSGTGVIQVLVTLQ